MFNFYNNFKFVIIKYKLYIKYLNYNYIDKLRKIISFFYLSINYFLI